MTTTRYDVAIAGAGPAGAAAAIGLAQAGRRVVLIDDAPAEGLKVGEALPGAARRLLARLGIGGLSDLLPPADYHACLANASAWGTDHWRYQDALANPDGGGWHLHRARFDAALRGRAAAAGAQLLPARVRRVVAPAAPGQPYRLYCQGPGPVVAELQADWLIDATGRRAWLSRQLGQPRERLGQQMAVVAWLASPAADTEAVTRVKAVPDGWWYTARLPGGHRVLSLHGLPATVAALARDPAELLRCFDAAGLLTGPVAGWPLLAVRTTDASPGRLHHAGGPGLLGVGDAALAFDPLSSQGIFFALYSGIMAAEALAAALADPVCVPAALARYQAQVEQVFVANQRARQHFYASEPRFAQAPYWQAARASLVPVPA